MLIVWGRRSSSNVQVVLWCLAELGVAYKRIDAGFTYGVVDTPAYRGMNPTGTVPTIRDGDVPAMFESGAILRYLASRYGAGPFWPEDPVERAAVDQWAEWSKINVATGFSAPVFWQAVRVPAERRDQVAIGRAVVALERHLAMADFRLAEHPYLTGETFTLADIQFGHVLFRYHDIDIRRADLPNLTRYYRELAGRPAYREHVMVSYAELADSM